MKKLKHIVALLLIAALMVNAGPAKASSTPPIVVRSDNCTTLSLSLYIDSGSGVAHCSASVLGKPGVSSISGGLLLYKMNGTKKKLIHTWHEGTLTNYLGASHTYKLSSRGTYMLTLNVNVFLDGVPETVNISRTATY
jgi:hypothetical protein